MSTAREELLSLQEAGERFGVSVYTVRRWIQSGKLRAFKPGKEYRVRESDLEEFLRAREVRPKAPRSSPHEPSFNDVLAEEERRRAFVERVKEHVEARVAHYETRLAEAAGYTGVRTLLDDALEEFVTLPDLINGELAERWMRDPEVPEDVKLELGRAVGEVVIKPLVEIVGRIGSRATALAKNTEQALAPRPRLEVVPDQDNVPRLKKIA